MEQSVNTALIQRWLPDPEHDPSSHTHDDLVSTVFQCVLSNFASLVKHLRPKFQSLDLRSLADTLRDELERLYLWGQGISFRTLEILLAENDDIGLSVLARLYELGTAILKALLPATTEVCASASEKVNSRFLGFTLEALLRTLRQKDQDVIEYSLPQKSENALADIKAATDDINVLIDCLMDLALAIEDVPINDEAEDLNEPDVENFMVSSVQAHVYCGRIRDRFRNAPKWLVERLGEANATRSEWILSRQPKEEQAYAIIETDKQTVVTSEVPSENVFSTFTGTSSVTNSDKVFDTAVLRTPFKSSDFKGLAGDEDTQSVVSLSSTGTTQSVVDQGRVRVPPLPKGALEGRPFNCLACSERVAFTSRSAWKKHIFEDLKPFICTVRNCSWKTLKYALNASWARHELTHRGETWVAEMCPLCADSATTYTTQKTFFTHLGKHLQEISLAAMPTLQHEYEEESCSEASEIDGDVDLPIGEDWIKSRLATRSKESSRDRHELSSTEPPTDPSVPTTGTNLAAAPLLPNRSGLETINETPSQTDAVARVAPGYITAFKNSTLRIEDSTGPPPLRDSQPDVLWPPGTQLQRTPHGDGSRAPSTQILSIRDLEEMFGGMPDHSAQDMTQESRNAAAAQASATSAYGLPRWPAQESAKEASTESEMRTTAEDGKTVHTGDLSSGYPDFYGDSDQQVPGLYKDLQADPYMTIDYAQSYVEMFRQDPQSSYYDNIWGGDIGRDEMDPCPSPIEADPASTSQFYGPTTDQQLHYLRDTLNQIFVCREPGCASKGFKRRADLKRHMDHVHAPGSMEPYACDYVKCARHVEPFKRKNHYRDHLREYHMEDLSRRNEPFDWYSSRSISSKWWRCARCLKRVSAEESESKCPHCNATVTQTRRQARGLV